jgi:hypothetical protein
MMSKLFVYLQHVLGEEGKCRWLRQAGSRLCTFRAERPSVGRLGDHRFVPLLCIAWVVFTLQISLAALLLN